jgi:hypothetical protein
VNSEGLKALVLIRLFMLFMSFMVQNHPAGFLLYFNVNRVIPLGRPCVGSSSLQACLGKPARPWTFQRMLHPPR